MRGVLIFGLWVLISLVAISFVGNHPYWALAIAIGGGVYLGWEELKRAELTRNNVREPRDHSE